MPKENVYSTSKDGFRAEVGWNREAGHVTLATTRDDVPVEEMGQLSAGHWVHLDRPGINRLIRALRRARDQAFGRDE